MFGLEGLPSGLLVDLYHIDSAHVSWQSSFNPVVTFDLYTRRNPFDGSYLLASGLEQALQFVKEFRFSSHDLDYLRAVRGYDEPFLSSLSTLRFSGDIHAIPEGEVAFAEEPLVRVTGPFQEALLLESGLLHWIGVSTLIATKASRIVEAASGKAVAEFGFRRAQAPFIASRAAYIGGCQSTSFLAAADRYDIPVTGTIPHSLVELFESEVDAFRAVAGSWERYNLLLDTYDVMQGADTAIEVAIEERKRSGHELHAVRLDSGDLAADAVAIRRKLDEAGLPDVKILASGDLDEWSVQSLVEDGAPIDGYGVGTRLATGAGSPERGIAGGSLGVVYKIVWVEGGEPPIKTAGDKSTWPGIKQVTRYGDFDGDCIHLVEEELPARGTMLLKEVMRNGACTGPFESLEAIRSRAKERLDRLPATVKRLDHPEIYPVTWSPALVDLRAKAMTRHYSAPR